MSNGWKIVGKDGVELTQCSFEESRVLVRSGPPSGFMTRLQEPPEAPIITPSKEIAEAIASILRQTNIEQFKNAKVIKA